MEDAREDFDNLVWDMNEEDWEQVQPELRRRSTIHLVEALATEIFGRPSTWVTPMNIGGYNIVYRLSVEDLSHIVVRRPIPCYAQFPEEKTLIEAATARYVEKQTKIPIASVLSHGQSPEMGSYLIMKYVEHQQSMSTALNATNDDTDKTFILDPNLSEDFVEDLYRKVAICLLELSQHTFPRIGSLVESTEGSFSITTRPITRDMNDMLQLAGIPRSILPPREKTYGTADEYYTELADLHLAQLIFQHNDLVTSADDCRNKYVSRQIFRRLAREGKISSFGFQEDHWSAQSKTSTTRLAPAPSKTSVFRLYCDDFRAGNVLLDDRNNIAAIIDWEFTYAAPTQFSLDPPWWLVLDPPEMWEAGLEDWVEFYEPRMRIWLSAMQKAEAAADSRERSMEVPLSTYMRESWETGRFWLTYAARKSWAFDALYWKFLDERFFGTRRNGVARDELWKTRLHLLSEKDQIGMESFVERKMEEIKERKLVEWEPEDARRRLAEVLGG
ncbi:phosphotransferase [Phlyctema vagabunda]|uniref:Phosphotransferase n=1 Tax=Phlyctema vagabunda TaxID=108571 RepID=A0ABR4PLI9_9HELO